MVPIKEIARIEGNLKAIKSKSNLKTVYDKDKFNDYQNFLYKRLMFGLKAYSQDEVNAMSKEKKKSIMKLHYRAQSELNIWKQSICNDLCNNFLKSLFPRSILANILVEKYGKDTDINYFNRVNFKDLKVTKEDIIRKFIDIKLLPMNYYQLSNQRLCK